MSTPFQLFVLSGLFALLPACGTDGAASDPAPDDSGELDSDEPEDSAEEDVQASWPLSVAVTLDGSPVEGALVVQPGGEHLGVTDASGMVDVVLDGTVNGSISVAASHPDARLAGTDFYSEVPDSLTIELERFDLSDNEAYSFQDPGSPTQTSTANYCSHCHQTFISDWYDSPHRSSASNVVVQDLYAGAAAAWDSQSVCEELGGNWWSGLEPGTREEVERCYLGDGVLPALNADCGETGSCDEAPEATGQCADCHAPAINGELGGRDLLEATEVAYESGIHCDLCHKVESVDLEATEPGVAGRLKILRPTEESPSPTLGEYKPLTFGPFHDVLNPRMGSVQRDHFRDGEICAGCHEYEQEVMVPDASIDTDRWPEGRLPVHSTWSERAESPFADGVACTSCHMPPMADVGNGADLGVYIGDEWIDTAVGYYRPEGQVRHHAWYGPRSEVQRMIDLAGALFLDVSAGDEELVVELRTANVGPAHAIPTGEPLRHLVALVELRCDGELLDAVGGHVVPGFGGERERRTSSEDWSTWPDAEVGDRIRVLQTSGDWHDYTGFGPFGDGSFDPEAKGMAEELYVGEAQVLAVDGSGELTLSAALPDGDLAVLVRDDGDWPAEGDALRDLSGRPGFGFARVMADAEGQTMVPHFLATDVPSDNRLLPGSSWTSTHRFAACEGTVEARAELVYRRLPGDLASERGWEITDAVMATSRWEGTP